jgi:hypothetical protein
MSRSGQWICRFVFLAFLSVAVWAKGKHKYDQGEKIMVWANKVGPTSSPTETYMYHDLPFCQPQTKDNKPLSLGDVVDGNRLIATQYDVGFRVDSPSSVLCSRHVSAEDVAAFRKAVSKDYYFQMNVDGLPVWGFVGRQEGGVDQLWTSFEFEFEWNQDRVISASVIPGNPVTLDGSLEKVEFTYSVSWKETKVRFAHRMDRYRNYQFLQEHMEIHWFSILNSFVTVLLLTGVLGSILIRVLRKDFARYTLLADEEAYEEDESSGTLLGAPLLDTPRRSLSHRKCSFALQDGS